MFFRVPRRARLSSPERRAPAYDLPDLCRRPCPSYIRSDGRGRRHTMTIRGRVFGNGRRGVSKETARAGIILKRKRKLRDPNNDEKTAKTGGAFDGRAAAIPAICVISQERARADWGNKETRLYTADGRRQSRAAVAVGRVFWDALGRSVAVDCPTRYAAAAAVGARTHAPATKTSPSRAIYTRSCTYCTLTHAHHDLLIHTRRRYL